MRITRDKALEILKQPDRIGCNLIKSNDEQPIKYNLESIEALNMAIKALEEIDTMAEALMGIAEYECCDYGYTEAFDIAERVLKECGRRL